MECTIRNLTNCVECKKMYKNVLKLEKNNTVGGDFECF